MVRYVAHLKINECLQNISFQHNVPKIWTSTFSIFSGVHCNTPSMLEQRIIPLNQESMDKKYDFISRVAGAVCSLKVAGKCRWD